MIKIYLNKQILNFCAPESSTTESSTFESSTTESTTILTSESSSESSTEATTETTIPTEGENPDELKSPISGARDSATRNNTAQPYRTGCVVAFGSFIKEHAVTLGGVGIALAFIQVNMYNVCKSKQILAKDEF